MKGDDIADRLLDLGVRVMRLVEALPRTMAGKHLAGQLLRSGTSAGANYEEARGAESRADFIHKLGIAWKETRESLYWLKLIHRSALIKPKPSVPYPLYCEYGDLTMTFSGRPCCATLPPRL